MKAPYKQIPLCASLEMRKLYQKNGLRGKDIAEKFKEYRNKERKKEIMFLFFISALTARNTTTFDGNTTVTDRHITLLCFSIVFYTVTTDTRKHEGNKIINLYMSLFPCVRVTVVYFYYNLDKCHCIRNVSVVWPSYVCFFTKIDNQTFHTSQQNR